MYGLMRQVLRRLEKGWRRQLAIHRLSKLDDQMLADIGLRRGQLPLLDFEAPNEDTRRRSPKPVYRSELVRCG